MTLRGLSGTAVSLEGMSTGREQVSTFF
jgi:hypothetical protein